MCLASVYSNKASCLAALEALSRSPPRWWSADCDVFVERLRRTPSYSTSHDKILLLVEGLDGVGKSTVTSALAERLGAALLRTPDPALSALREVFRAQSESVARAFYTAANYTAADDALRRSGGRRFVVLDRWWCSTRAMALARAAALPPPGDLVYAAPTDLPPVRLGALLTVAEETRRRRIERRAPPDAEERQLAASRDMREAAMTAYRRFGVLEEVAADTYGVAVNRILALMTERGIEHDAVPFTEEELAQIQPY